MKDKGYKVDDSIIKSLILLLVLCTCLNFTGCRGNSEPPPDNATGENKRPVDGSDNSYPGTQWKDKLEEEFNCNILYMTAIDADSTFTVVYVSPHDAKSNHFYSDTLTEIYAAHYKLKNNRLDVIKSQKLHDVSWSYLEIDTTSWQPLNIDGKPYFYFSALETNMGKAIVDQNVVFHLISLSGLSDYQLVYTGKYGFQCEDCIIGEFAADKALTANRRLYDVLMGLSSKSNMIYHKSEQDKDPYSWLNYETKWNEDNKVDYSFGAGHGEIIMPVKTTYYKTDLFALNKGSVTDSVENEDYKIVSYFRSNLIGYDKKRQFYFPIIIESCNYSCAKTISFTDAAHISIQYEDEGEAPTALSLKDDLVFDAVVGK